MVTEAQMTSYLAAIASDYATWTNNCCSDDPAHAAAQIAKFKQDLKYTDGKKYIKVVRTGCGVHSFIVKEDGVKFKRGDILKAASWAAPALNFARGNVVAGLYANVKWTSPQ